MIKIEWHDFGRGIGKHPQVIQKVEGGTIILDTLTRVSRGGIRGYVSDSLPGFHTTLSAWVNEHRQQIEAVSAK